jgi:indolepyruvate decarboxylase
MTSSALPTVGSFLFDYLYNKGVRHVFGIPGDFALPTFRWLNQSRLDLITMTHEPSVGFAADGYSRASGRIGVACVTYCVGGLNMLNSVACAYAEKSPLLVISGGPSPTDRHLDPLTHHRVRTFDSQRRIFEEVTCAHAVLSDPETAASEIIRVIDAMEAQCRPGYLEIPYDVVDMPIKLPIIKNEPAPKSDAELLEAALLEATDFINKAKQPVIIADIELHRHGMTELALKLATEKNIPIAATLLSKSIISETNPMYIGVYSGGFSEPAVLEYIDQSDCLILLGAFISDVFLGMNSVKLDRKKCILANTEKTRIGLHNFEHIQFADFMKGLVSADVKPRGSFTNPNPAVEPDAFSAAEQKEHLTADAVFRSLQLNMGNDTTLVCDTGDSLFGAISLRTGKSNNFLSDAYYLSMGFATPASIGAMAANPDRRVIAIVGDGAFQMTGIELSTAAKLGMKPVVIILNNDGYGTQRYIIDGPFNNIHNWDYPKLTELLRYGRSVRVDTKGGFDDALRDALASDEMVLIEAVIPRDDATQPLKRVGAALAAQRDVSKRSTPTEG